MHVLKLVESPCSTEQATLTSLSNHDIVVQPRVMSNPALGAAAVIGAIAAFGSFGVPIKSRRLQQAGVHSIPGP